MNLVYTAKVTSDGGLSYRASAGRYVSLYINDRYIQTITSDQVKDWNVYPSIFHAGDVVRLQAHTNGTDVGPALTAIADRGPAVSPFVVAAVVVVAAALVWVSRKLVNRA